ncbi:hypothetical protein LEAN103870_15930 [Legionella anisa]|uniref:Uncharacterized protein n=1 Tax=Legionella anisa TaxID=28082 RepID=A0AAX0WRZ2_9GAMM|nr:hypothetical protein [Legionella anisa]AWN74964.1 hypothetical protein DLD14_14585 [Legionella anisa]KTC72280.1 hypothetical protein Lani_1414 [Legionella anisa]MCW8424833.1 hypothetical protein [Legionella anisa]MCW8446048.1 hypothetical protein [Legionella anisa]PNL61079.1 hypothetical protein A6J39_007555 [Legionella anisa]
MRYKITEQFARGEEKVIADFSELNDTHIFLAKKSANADLEKQKIIFRLYDNSDLLHEINRETISVAHANYAEGNGDLYLIQLPFHVMFKAQDVLEKREIANFNDKNDANLFIIGKCESDESIQDNDLFFLFKEQNLIDTLTRIINTHREKEATRTTKNEKGAKFHPTPMSRRPIPPGGPSDCWVEEDDDNPQ